MEMATTERDLHKLQTRDDQTRWNYMRHGLLTLNRYSQVSWNWAKRKSPSRSSNPQVLLTQIKKS